MTLLQVSFIVRTRCTIRNTDVLLGIRANFPFLLANLPEARVFGSTHAMTELSSKSLRIKQVVLAIAGVDVECDILC